MMGNVSKNHTVDLEVCDGGNGRAAFQLRELLGAEEHRGQVPPVGLDTGTRNDIIRPGLLTLRGYHGDGAHTLPYTPIRVLSMYCSLEMNLEMTRTLLKHRPGLSLCSQCGVGVTSGPPAGPAPPVFPVSS